jgi:hypothetical protein
MLDSLRRKMTTLGRGLCTRIIQMLLSNYVYIASRSLHCARLPPNACILQKNAQMMNSKTKLLLGHNTYKNTIHTFLGSICVLLIQSHIKLESIS